MIVRMRFWLRISTMARAGASGRIWDGESRTGGGEGDSVTGRGGIWAHFQFGLPGRCWDAAGTLPGRSRDVAGETRTAFLAGQKIRTAFLAGLKIRTAFLDGQKTQTTYTRTVFLAGQKTRTAFWSIWSCPFGHEPVPWPERNVFCYALWLCW